jgi:hypothetical protein
MTQSTSAAEFSPEEIEVLYDEGLEHERNENLAGAAACYEQAARLDFADSALRLGVVLERQNRATQARYWYTVALDAGFPEAVDRLAELDRAVERASTQRDATASLPAAPSSDAQIAQQETGPRTPLRGTVERQVVDHALQRRALLAEVNAGRIDAAEVCDASPHLLRAAKFHGESTDAPCPICHKESMSLVSWVYGDELKHLSGSARTAEELTRMAGLFAEVRVHVVEVCHACHWNHLLRSYVLGRYDVCLTEVKHAVNGIKRIH